MPSSRNFEGYFLLDHRDSPGIPESLAVQSGLPPNAGRGLFEAPTYTCSHCQKVCIVKLPRETEVPFCPKCSHHVCGTCGKRREADGGACKPFKQIVDEILAQASKQAEAGSPLILLP